MTMVSILAGYLLIGCLVTTATVVYALVTDRDFEPPHLGAAVLIWPTLVVGLVLIAASAIARRFSR